MAIGSELWEGASALGRIVSLTLQIAAQKMLLLVMLVCRLQSNRWLPSRKPYQATVIKELTVLAALSVNQTQSLGNSLKVSLIKFEAIFSQSLLFRFS